MWVSKYKSERSFSGIGAVSLSVLRLLHLIPQICCNQSGFTHQLSREQAREGGSISLLPAFCVLRHCIKVAQSLLGRGFAITHVRPSHIMFMDMIDWILKLPFAQMIPQFLQAYCIPLIVQSFNNEVEISQDSLKIPSFSFISFFFFLPPPFLGTFLLHTLFSSFLWAGSIYQVVLREIKNEILNILLIPQKQQRGRQFIAAWGSELCRIQKFGSYTQGRGMLFMRPQKQI